MRLADNSSFRSASALLALLLMGAVVPSASATTYYVDPATGSDSNSGTTTGLAWRNPPGTRDTADSAFIGSAWGAITSSNKVPCGTLILLKGGSTQVSAQGGAWRIDPTYYTSTCTTSARIVIRVATAAEWSGSSGNFIINASGVTATCVSNCGSGGFSGIIDLENMSYITVGGVSASQRLEVSNANSGNGGSEPSAVCANANGAAPNGIKVQWGDFHDGTFGGVGLGAQNNWLVTDTMAHDNGGPGFHTGFWVDKQVADGGFQNCEAYNNGSSERAGMADAFFFTGGLRLWCVNCQTHDNWQRGVNSGQVNDTASYNHRFRNLRAWNNGRTVDANVAKCGFGFSGDDLLDGSRYDNWIVGAILYRNPRCGGWFGYGDGQVELWHGVFYGDAYSAGMGEFAYDRSSDYAAVYNSIFQKRAGTTVYGANNANMARDRVPYSNNNIYRAASSTSESLAAFSFSAGCTPGSPGTYSGSGTTFAQGICWAGASDKISGRTGCGGTCDQTNTDPKFVATDETVFGNTNFHLQSGSAAIDMGRFLMRASGAGSNASTINVLGNGGTNNPQNYFIGPSSYLDATPDTIQIEGCGRVTITGMTTSAITFTPACSWASGAGIHLPWLGTAPDAGAFEFEQTGSGNPAAPALLSVEVLP